MIFWILWVKYQALLKWSLPVSLHFFNTAARKILIIEMPCIAFLLGSTHLYYQILKSFSLSYVHLSLPCPAWDGGRGLVWRRDSREASCDFCKHCVPSQPSCSQDPLAAFNLPWNNASTGLCQPAAPSLEGTAIYRRCHPWEVIVPQNSQKTLLFD